jgi:hypothetical protein
LQYKKNFFIIQQWRSIDRWMGDVIDKFSILNLSEVWLLLFYLDLFLKKKKQAKKWQTFENNWQNFYI